MPEVVDAQEKQKKSQKAKPPVIVESDLMNIPESAGFLRLSPHTIRAMIYQERLPVVRLGRRCLLKKSDLLAFIEKGWSGAKS